MNGPWARNVAVPVCALGAVLSLPFGCGDTPYPCPAEQVELGDLCLAWRFPPGSRGRRPQGLRQMEPTGFTDGWARQVAIHGDRGSRVELRSLADVEAGGRAFSIPVSEAASVGDFDNDGTADILIAPRALPELRLGIGDPRAFARGRVTSWVEIPAPEPILRIHRLVPEARRWGSSLRQTETWLLAGALQIYQLELETTAAGQVGATMLRPLGLAGPVERWDTRPLGNAGHELAVVVRDPSVPGQLNLAVAELYPGQEPAWHSEALAEAVVRDLEFVDPTPDGASGWWIVDDLGGKLRQTGGRRRSWQVDGEGPQDLESSGQHTLLATGRSASVSRLGPLMSLDQSHRLGTLGTPRELKFIPQATPEHGPQWWLLEGGEQLGLQLRALDVDSAHLGWAAGSVVSTGLGEIHDAVVAGDFDGDGQQDLAAWTGEGLRIVFGDGEKTYGRPLERMSERVRDRVWLWAHDYGDDGRSALVVLHRGADSEGHYLAVHGVGPSGITTPYMRSLSIDLDGVSPSFADLNADTAPELLLNFPAAGVEVSAMGPVHGRAVLFPGGGRASEAFAEPLELQLEGDGLSRLHISQASGLLMRVRQRPLGGEASEAWRVQSAELELMRWSPGSGSGLQRMWSASSRMQTVYWARWLDLDGDGQNEFVYCGQRDEGEARSPRDIRAGHVGLMVAPMGVAPDMGLDFQRAQVWSDRNCAQSELLALDGQQAFAHMSALAVHRSSVPGTPAIDEQPSADLRVDLIEPSFRAQPHEPRPRSRILLRGVGGVHVLDVDGDGRPELLGSRTGNYSSVVRTPALAQIARFPVHAQGGWTMWDFEDVDLDGQLDLLRGSRGESGLWLNFGDEALGFAGGPRIDLAEPPRDLRIVELDGGEGPELVVYMEPPEPADRDIATEADHLLFFSRRNGGWEQQLRLELPQTSDDKGRLYALADLLGQAPQLLLHRPKDGELWQVRRQGGAWHPHRVPGRIFGPMLRLPCESAFGGEVLLFVGDTHNGAKIFEPKGGELKLLALHEQPLGIRQPVVFQGSSGRAEVLGVVGSREGGLMLQTFPLDEACRPQPGPTLAEVALVPRLVDVGDFNGDGYDELVVADDYVTQILAQGEDGQLEAAANLLSVPQDLAVRDLNGDGRAELVTYSFGEINVLAVN